MGLEEVIEKMERSNTFYALARALSTISEHLPDDQFEELEELLFNFLNKHKLFPKQIE